MRITVFVGMSGFRVCPRLRGQPSFLRMGIGAGRRGSVHSAMGHARPARPSCWRLKGHEAGATGRWVTPLLDVRRRWSSGRRSFARGPRRQHHIAADLLRRVLPNSAQRGGHRGVPRLCANGAAAGVSRKGASGQCAPVVRAPPLSSREGSPGA